MTRSLRRWTTWICLAGFAFAQLALAAYACPLRAPTPVATLGANVDADPTDRCPGHTDFSIPEAGPLCEAHCEGQTTVPGGGTVVVPPLVLAPFPVVVPIDIDPWAIAEGGRAPRVANATAPPVGQRYGKLLI